MASKARRAFDQNAKDVERLLEIHQDLGGDARGRRYRLDVLNKSAIVLITALWEAYCEDLAAEALDHLVIHMRNASTLPKELKKRIAKEIKADPNDIAMWTLADAGWKAKIRERLAALTEERNRRLNTPKSDNIDQLFADAIGLSAVSAKWSWTKMTVDTAKKKLDGFVALRGAIAHRGKGSTSCKKAQVEDYFAHVKRLVAKTGGSVNTFVRGATKVGLWGDRQR
jgi:hypothetical protein